MTRAPASLSLSFKPHLGHILPCMDAIIGREGDEIQHESRETFLVTGSSVSLPAAG